MTGVVLGKPSFEAMATAEFRGLLAGGFGMAPEIHAQDGQ